jgi:hypothetical protein
MGMRPFVDQEPFFWSKEIVFARQRIILMDALGWRLRGVLVNQKGLSLQRVPCWKVSVSTF